MILKVWGLLTRPNVETSVKTEYMTHTLSLDSKHFWFLYMAFSRNTKTLVDL